MDPKTNPTPFDGKRMIFGGFTPVIELGAPELEEQLLPHAKSAKGERSGKDATPRH